MRCAAYHPLQRTSTHHKSFFLQSLRQVLYNKCRDSDSHLLPPLSSSLNLSLCLCPSIFFELGGNSTLVRKLGNFSYPCVRQTASLKSLCIRKVQLPAISNRASCSCSAFNQMLTLMPLLMPPPLNLFEGFEIVFPNDTIHRHKSFTIPLHLSLQLSLCIFISRLC